MESASLIAREAWKLAEAGSVDEAIARYQPALEIADDAIDDLWHIHGEFGAVLAKAQQFERAIEQHRASARASLRKGELPNSTGVQVERCFAASLLLHLGKPTEALAEISTVLSGGDVQPFVRSVEAEALYLLGQRDRASIAARKAIDSARNEEQ